MKKMISIRLQKETIELLQSVYRAQTRENTKSWESFIESLLQEGVARFLATVIQKTEQNLP